MVYILSGKINQGKTGKVLLIYNEDKSGDGFITRKIIEKGIFKGYEIVRLSSLDKVPFIYKNGFIPYDWDEEFKYGLFSFSKTALTFAGHIIDEIIADGTNPVYIDEIGPVELGGKGFSKLLIKALNTDGDLYITVRESCVEEVIKRFNIQKYKIIQI